MVNHSTFRYDQTNPIFGSAPIILSHIQSGYTVRRKRSCHWRQLSADLLHSIRTSFGEEGIEKILESHLLTQKKQYQEQLSDESNLKTRIHKLFMIRMNEGYFAEVQEQEDGSFLFIQKHCPIIEAAAICSGFCRNEAELFQSVLGDHVTVERVEYLLSGGSRCAYRISKYPRENLIDGK
jgi:predicted ArsR family transcriptional regulator